MIAVIAAHPSPAIFGALAILCVLTGAAYLRLTGEEGTHHKAPRRGTRSLAGAGRAWRRADRAARRLPGAVRRWFERDLDAYDRETLALLPAMRTEDTGGLRALHAPDTSLVPGAASSSHFLGAVTTATCPAAAMAVKVDSPAPENVPGPEVGTADTRDGDPVTVPGDQAPGPDGLPEGDTHPVLWPPQETAGPGDLPPMSPLLAGALRELEDAERWPHLAKDAGYADSRPFRDWERDSVVMPAIRGL